MTGLQEKTTYRLVPFLFGDNRARDALQRKATGEATSEMVRETAGWTRPNLTLRMSILASIRPLLCGGSPFFLYSGDGRRFRRNSK